MGVMSFLQWEDHIGVRDQWDLIQHTHQQITQTAENHEFFLLIGVSVRKFYGMVSDICFEIIRDSCDGSGLNTIESSKSSHP